MMGTSRRRHTMAITMPIMAPGLKPSRRELPFGMGIMAGGASGVRVVVGRGAGAMLVFVVVVMTG